VQRGAAADQRLGIIRTQDQRSIVARQRFIEPPELVQDDTTVVERFDVIRLQIERTVVAGQRLFAAPQPIQRVSAIAERIGIIRPQGDGAIIVASASPNCFSSWWAMPRLTSASTKSGRNASAASKLASAPRWRRNACRVTPRLLNASG